MAKVFSVLAATCARIVKTLSYAKLALYLTAICCFVVVAGLFFDASRASHGVINRVTPSTITPQDTNNSAFVVDVPVPVKLAIITEPFTATVGQCGGVAGLPITVQLQDATGNKAQSATNTVVNLTSSSMVSSFYSDAQCIRAVTSVVISTAGHSAGFYYKDAIDGMTAITAADAANALSSATQIETIVAAPSVCASPSFSAAMNFVVGALPLSVAVGDFNADGKADVAAANNSSNTVSILIGNGTGGFAAATNFIVGANPRSVAIGDFNGDGKADVISASQSANNVSLLLGNGAGGFAAATNFAVGSLPFSVGVGDFNGDGRADVVTGNFNSTAASILLNNGAGGFAAATNFNVGISAQSVAVGDFNADGKSDIAIGKLASSNNVAILLGNGAGGFAAVTNFTVPAAPISVVIADFNLDGRADLATANSNSNNISILLGNGLGSFAAPANFTAGTAPAAIAVGDFNADGKDDIATGNQNSNNISILLGNGAGGFGSPSNFAAAQPRSVAIGDFNSDGRPDVVAAIFANPSSVSILLNSCISASDLSLAKSHTGNFTIGTNGNYTLTVSNAAGAAATSNMITVTDILPTGLSFASGTGTGWSCSASGQNVTCANSNSLAAGASSPALTLMVSVGPGTAVGTNSITNTANVSIAGETNTGNNTASDPTTVNRANQTITFGALADKTYGDADFLVSATASSGLTVSYMASGSCTVSGTTVHITAAGSCTITASQGGSASYDAAPDVAQSFTINNSDSTTNVSVGNATYDGQPHGATASVTGLGDLSQTLTVTYTGRNATVYGPSTTAPTNAGDYTASASFSGDNDHNSSSDSKDYSIARANVIINITPYNVTYDGNPHTAVGAATGVESPSPADLSSLLDLGGTTHTNASSYPADAWLFAGNNNYNAAGGTISDQIDKAPSTVTLSCPVTETYTGFGLTPCSASVAGAGGLGQSLVVTYTNNINAGTATATTAYAGDANHAGSSDTKNFTIDKAEQGITWGDPAPVIYGTALSFTQLNAAVAVIGPALAGAVTYTPSLGAVLHAGAHQPLTINVAATQNYNAAAKTVYLDVHQATPVITWNTPAAIASGTALSIMQLNATAVHPTVAGPLAGTSVTGTFAYTPAAGAVLPGGDSTLSVVFTPANTADYTTAIESVIQHVGVLYNVCPLFDQTKAAKSGSTLPIKLKLCSVTGANLSTPSLVVNAIGLQLVSTNSWGEVEDFGNANSDLNFRYTVFDQTTPGYIFNLKTKGLASGVYQLGFTVSGDQTVYTVQFQIK